MERVRITRSQQGHSPTRADRGVAGCAGLPGISHLLLYIPLFSLQGFRRVEPGNPGNLPRSQVPPPGGRKMANCGEFLKRGGNPGNCSLLQNVYDTIREVLECT